LSLDQWEKVFVIPASLTEKSCSSARSAILAKYQLPSPRSLLRMVSSSEVDDFPTTLIADEEPMAIVKWFR
jgi:hypothetical protein